MRSGTTFLYSLLKSHPQVFLPELKETRFFLHDLDDPERPKKVQEGRPVTMEDYLGLYSECSSQHIAAGDISPQYIHSATASNQIAEFNPAAKLILILRNPADRFFSLFNMNAENSSLSAIDAFRAGGNAVKNSFISVNVENYLGHFPREQVLAIRFELITSDPDELKRRVADHLEIDVAGFPAEFKGLRGAGGKYRHPAIATLRRYARKHGIAHLMPRAAVTKLQKLLGSKKQAPSPLTDLERGEILEYYSDDSSRLAELLDLDLADWQPNYQQNPGQ